MANVAHLKYKLSLKGDLSGSFGSPAITAFNIGGSSPGIFDKVLTVHENGLIVFFDSTTNELYSNRNPILSEDGKTLTFEE